MLRDIAGYGQVSRNLEPDLRWRPAPRQSRKNVGGIERAFSLLAGGALVAGSTYLALNKRTGTGLLLGALGGGLVYRGVSGHCGLYSRLGIGSEDARRGSHPLSRSIHVDTGIIIDRPVEELFEFWRDFSNLPRIMSHLERVDILDATRSRWVAQGPVGRSVEWIAEITDEEPNEMIAWQSVPGSDIDHQGVVHFWTKPGGEGTVIKVSMSYHPPAGVLGLLVARLLGETPEQQIQEDLRRFKRDAENGEIPQEEAAPLEAAAEA